MITVEEDSGSHPAIAQNTPDLQLPSPGKQRQEPMSSEQPSSQVSDRATEGIAVEDQQNTSLTDESTPKRPLTNHRRIPSHSRSSSARNLRSTPPSALSTTRALSGSIRSHKSRIGTVYRKEGMKIKTSESAHEQTLPNTREADANWTDVYRACCIHTGAEWLKIGGLVGALFSLLYFFLIGLDLLGTSFAVVGGCTAGSLLGGQDTNPLASVIIGLIATAIFQSSSTTTAIIVSLVSGGLDVKQGIYMVMGANVGTTITPMLVSLAHISDTTEIMRAFSASSMYFAFNALTIIVLFPLEITTGYLYHLTKTMLPSTVSAGDSWEGPIKKIVSPIVKSFIVANNDLIKATANNEVSCTERYPIQCEGPVSYENCQETAGVIGCHKKTGRCPIFFQVGASKRDDMVSGWVCLVIAMFILISCLIGLVSLLRTILLGASTRIIYKATNINDLLAIAIGCGVTILVQSSSITTSTLVPLAGVGVLQLEKLYPLILGADIGTTMTALMASMVSSKVESLQIALVHLFFNVTGIVIWYPVPFMRRIVFHIAQMLGQATGSWRTFPFVFIALTFLIIPLLLLGITSCFDQRTKGFTALGIFLVVIIVGTGLYSFIWWSFLGGSMSFHERIEQKRRHTAALETLPDELDYLRVDTEWCKNEIGRIKDFASQAGIRFQRRREDDDEDADEQDYEEGAVEGRGHRDDIEAQGHEEDVHAVTGEADNLYFATDDIDDRLSLFHSCRSGPWRDILVAAAGSIRSGL